MTVNRDKEAKVTLGGSLHFHLFGEGKEKTVYKKEKKKVEDGEGA